MNHLKLLESRLEQQTRTDSQVKKLQNFGVSLCQKNILRKIPNKVDHDICSLYTDYESDHTKPYTAILGCKVENLDNIPNGMVGKSFSGGTYTKTTAKGDLMQRLVVNQWSKIFEMELDRTYDADFEIFGKKAQNPSDAEVDFYVGIKQEMNG